MSLNAICYALLLAVFSCRTVSGHFTSLAADLTPPSPLQQHHQQNSLAQQNPLHVPSHKFTQTLPVPAQIPSFPSLSSPTAPNNLLSSNFPTTHQFPVQQFPTKPPPQLPPALQSQLPVQLAPHLQQQIPFQLQPQFNAPTNPTFNVNLPPVLQPNQQSHLLPPQLPAQLPSQYPPIPSNTNFPRPIPTSKFPPLTSSKNISNEVTRGPKTLQMIGSNNPFMLHKISDNLRPGSTTWYYRKNNKLMKNTPPSKSSFPPPASPLQTSPNALQQYQQLSQFASLSPPSTSFSQTTHNFNNPSTIFTSPSTSFNSPSTTFTSTSFNSPSISFNSPSTSFNSPSTTFTSTSFNSPSTSLNSPSNSLNSPSSTFASTSFNSPSSSFNNPSTSFTSTSLNSPSTSFSSPSSTFNQQTTSYNIPSSSLNQQTLNPLSQFNQLTQLHSINQQNQHNQFAGSSLNIPLNTNYNQPNHAIQQPSTILNQVSSNSDPLRQLQLANILNQLNQSNPPPFLQNQGYSGSVKPITNPLIPQEIFNSPEFHIQPISIPSPDSPHFETVRNQVSFLKAKHKQFFDQQGPKQQKPSFNNFGQHHHQQQQQQHQSQHPPKLYFDQFNQPEKTWLEQLQQLSNSLFDQPQSPPVHHHLHIQAPQPFQPKPQAQSLVQSQQSPPQQPAPVYGPPKSSKPLKHVFEINQTTQKPNINQIQLTTRKPPHPVQQPQSSLLPASWNTGHRAPVIDYDQYSSPKKVLPVQNDFVGFPPAKGSIKNELNFISTWEKAIGIIHKNDHDSEKGHTILSSGDTDDFKKIDNGQNSTQNEEESSNVEVISADKSHFQPEAKEEKPQKKKKAHAKKRPMKKHREMEETSDATNSVEGEDNKSAEPNLAESEAQHYRSRRKRDLAAVEVSPENANTAAPLIIVAEEDTPEPLVAPETEPPVTEVVSQATEKPTNERSVGTSVDESLALDDSSEVEWISGEEVDDEELPHAEALVFDDYDGTYLDYEAYAPSVFQVRSDNFIFEELDGTTQLPHALPYIAEQVGNVTVVIQPEALVDPRSLHGRELMLFLEEAIRNSSRFLPDEAEDRSFDVVDPPTDVIKFPYYDRTEEPINVDSALRFAENLTTFSKGLYKSKSANLCNEVDIELDEEPAEPGPDGFKPVRRLKRLGEKIDCLKNKNFGKEPLDNPLFKEEFVGVARSAPDGLPTPQPQPDPSVAVFSDVIRLIKQHLTEEHKQHTRDVSQILAPRQLNLSDPKTTSPNNAVLEQLRLGKRRILPKPAKTVEEVKHEVNQTAPSEQHPLRIVFPRRLNFTKTYEEAKKVSLAKLTQTKLAEQEKTKQKLNESRTDHNLYKASLARKLNFDKIEKLKTPKSQRRDSNVEQLYDSTPKLVSYHPRATIFDISTYYPKQTYDELYSFPNVDGKEKGFASKNFRTLEREADELLESVRRDRDKAEKRIVNTGRSNREHQDYTQDRPYGTSYSPLYKEFQALSTLKKARQVDDQKKPPSLNQLINFYSQRSDSISSNQRSYTVPKAHGKLPIFDVSTFYPRYSARVHDESQELHDLVTKRRDSKINLEDLEALQAPPKESLLKARQLDQKAKHVTPAPLRDDIADFFEDSLAQPTSSTPSIAPKEEHHTFKKAEPSLPDDLPKTDKAALDQTIASASVKKALADPPKSAGRRKHLKTKPKILKRPLIKYRRKKKLLKYYH